MAAAEEVTRPRVVIVGGGFGGLYAARLLKHANAEIVVVDRRNHHLFQPLLYQVATAGLAAPDVAAPIRKVLRRHANTRVLMDDVTAVDLAGKRVLCGGVALAYDYLILAPGATDNWFGHDEWTQHAQGLKTTRDALIVRNRLLLAFEAAERETDPAKRRALLTFVVVGGGPTGVEMAGSMAEIAQHTLARDFRAFDPGDARVVLVEGIDRLLPVYPAELSRKAEEHLRKLRVDVRTSTRVTDIRDGEVVLQAKGHEEVLLAASLVVWAAGVKAEPVTATLGVPLDRGGRVLVQPDLSVPGHGAVFVIGDAAAVKTGPDGAWVPGVAPAAIQMGKHAARNVLRLLSGKAATPFEYVDRGSLATIGRSAAVADFGRVRFSGMIAWLLWLFVHIFFLIGFRNRFVVLFEWAWAYFSFQRSARVILTERSGTAG